MVKIIEYNPKYDEKIKDLFLELQEYIAFVDREGYNIVTNEFREEAFKATLEEVRKGNGKILLASDDNKIVGFIIGIIIEEEDTYDFKAPACGEIIELIVSKDCRAKGIGQTLLENMEAYFKSVGCKRILIEVFEYNDIAKNFYNKNNYFTRCRSMMKKIN